MRHFLEKKMGLRVKVIGLVSQWSFKRSFMSWCERNRRGLPEIASASEAE
jgi:hypothetical protein